MIVRVMAESDSRCCSDAVNPSDCGGTKVSNGTTASDAANINKLADLPDGDGSRVKLDLCLLGHEAHDNGLDAVELLGPAFDERDAGRARHTCANKTKQKWRRRMSRKRHHQTDPARRLQTADVQKGRVHAGAEGGPGRDRVDGDGLKGGRRGA